MENKEPQNTAYEDFKSRRLAELAEMPPHKDWEPINGIYIPYGDVVTIKECTQEEYKTKSGIIMQSGEHLEHCKIGYIINKGELCSIPVNEGDTVAFDKHCGFGFQYKGINYLRVPTFQVFFRVPPETYLEPHYKDFFEKRRESRIAGQKKAQKRDDDKLNQKFDDRDSFNKKKDYIEGKPADGKTIIKL